MYPQFNFIIHDIFYKELIPFEAFTMTHGWPIIAVAAFYGCIILLAKNIENHNTRKNIGVMLALIPLITVTGRMIITYDQGLFTLEDELPLHLCRTLAYILPLAVFIRSRLWLGICYFSIIGGTLQAIITPDIDYGWPHYSYIIYWITHVGLFMGMVYVLVVMKFKPRLKDLWNTMIFLNAYMLVTLAVNLTIDANYFYTKHKPSTASLLDYFGPWPVYLIVVEFLALIVFYIIYLPYRATNRNEISVQNEMLTET